MGGVLTADQLAELDRTGIVKIEREDPDSWPAGPVFGMKYWAFFGDVVPGGGGTPQLVGSHKPRRPSPRR